MTKPLVKIDRRLLQAAKTALGAGTSMDSVNRALERVVCRHACEGTTGALRAFAEATIDLADPEVMNAAW